MMLSHLKLKDLILIENAEIEFGKGLNIFTGETGSGKSAILTAIRLIAGERADSEWIRAGANVAIVEARLLARVPEFLRDIAPPEAGECLTIRREIHRSGKSRCFIEDQLINVTILRQFMHPLLEIVDQSSSSEISLPEKQRQLLDIYAGLEKGAEAISTSFTAINHAKQKLESVVANALNRNRDLEWAKTNLKEIEEVNWQKGEEEHLNQNHLLLTHAQELTQKISEAADGLSSILPTMQYLAHLLDKMVYLDAHLDSSARTLKTCALELDETESFLRSYVSRLEINPNELVSVESRIGAIEAIKRRFGSCWEDIQQQKQQLSKEIDRLLNLDDHQAALSGELKELEQRTLAEAQQLSIERRKAAKEFSQDILEQLKHLNLPHAKLEVQITPKPLSSHGIDEIRFLFSANPGTALLPLEQCASGGELSRLLFATKVVLTEKEGVQCLIFDEIDSNVGGQTATVLGEKLKQISQRRQVICVTHFVQVARLAMHHFVVAKQDKDGRATTVVEQLSKEHRDREYARMIGK